MYEKLLKVVANLGSPKVLVVGDFMLDVYVYGDALRISPEAPVPVLKVCRTDYGCGGAGSVAADVAALHGTAYCLGVIGNDRNGEILMRLLGEAGVETGGLLVADDNRPTISKQRLIGLAQHRHRQQLMRMDQESSEPLSDAQYGKILESYEQLLAKADIVCLQDYNKGLLSEEICSQMIKLGRESGKSVLVDPCLTRDFSKYTGASCITPNRKEASAAVGFEITSADTAASAAERLAETLHIEAVVITLDCDGAYLKTGQVAEIVPTRPRSVYDVTGAGDTVLATLAVALAAGVDHKTAVQLANIAGGIEVEKFGAATVTIEEIINEIIADNRGKAGKVRALDDLLHELKWRRTQNQTIVFTNGCFDVVHRGHIEFLKFCKGQGDIVVVGLNSDGSVKSIKGPQRPINNQYDRAAVLAAMESVDYIVVFDEPEPLNLVRKVRPDVLVKGRDWAEKGVVGREFVESYGAKVVLAPLVEGKSSSSVIEKMKSLWKKF
ncbi:MAG TPA: bifunctional heptose 7-phosphate kinase/heptose 1-phosphate adenyltransferase [Sedimentisphaerales bacterium]|nr:bifunctional heptose 7-phosphate kinase/heptose 1-phosphate adenyltransferase [Sedimentisphaerales bacterium]